MPTKKTTLTARRHSKPTQHPRFRIKVVLHPAEEGGYWVEVPALPGCVSEGDTLQEALANIREAIHGCLSVDVKEVELTERDLVEDVEL